MTDRCRSCDAPIEWAITEKGRRIPLDLGEHPDGNLDIVNGNAVYVAADGRPHRRSHFATCSNPDRHRRKRSRR